MEIDRIKTLCNLTEIKKSATNVSYSDIITDNTFTFNKKHWLIEHKKTNGGIGQYFAIRFDDVNIGDILEIEFDYYKVSGDDINIVLKENGVVNGNTTLKLNSNPNSFIKVKHKFIANKETLGNSTQIEIGYATAEIGHYKIKNVKCRIIDKYIKPHGKTLINGLLNKTPNQDFSFHSEFVNDEITLERNGNNIKLNFKTSNKRAMLNINKLALGNTLDYDFYQVLGQNTFCEFAIFNKGTSTKVNIDDILDKELWLNISVIVEY